MASHFLRILGGVGMEKKIVTCFLNYLRFYVNKKYDEQYWERNKPN